MYLLRPRPGDPPDGRIAVPATVVFRAAYRRRFERAEPRRIGDKCRLTAWPIEKFRPFLVWRCAGDCGHSSARIDGPNTASSARLTTGQQPAPAVVRAQPGGRSRARGTIGSCSSSAAEFSSLALAEASEVQSATSRAGRVARLAQWRLPWLVRSRDDRAWDISGAKWQSPVAPAARHNADCGGLVRAAHRRFGPGYAH